LQQSGKNVPSSEKKNSVNGSANKDSSSKEVLPQDNANEELYHNDFFKSK